MRLRLRKHVRSTGKLSGGARVPDCSARLSAPSRIFSKRALAFVETATAQLRGLKGAISAMLTGAERDARDAVARIETIDALWRDRAADTPARPHTGRRFQCASRTSAGVFDRVRPIVCRAAKRASPSGLGNRGRSCQLSSSVRPQGRVASAIADRFRGPYGLQMTRTHDVIGVIASPARCMHNPKLNRSVLARKTPPDNSGINANRLNYNGLLIGCW